MPAGIFISPATDEMNFPFGVLARLLELRWETASRNLPKLLVYWLGRVLALASPAKGANLSFFAPFIRFLICAFLLATVLGAKPAVYFLCTFGALLLAIEPP